MIRMLGFFLILFLSGMSVAEDAVEATGSCIVIHEQGEANSESSMTCFENIALERTSFESGVCRWMTEAQADAAVKTTTKFVPHCPVSYSAFCDRLVLGSGHVAPVKIFLYDRSDEVLGRARKHCLSGGGKWIANDAKAAESSQ